MGNKRFAQISTNDEDEELPQRQQSSEENQSKKKKRKKMKLLEGLTSEEMASKEPDESERMQMTDARCSRCSEFKAGVRDIIQAGHGDHYQVIGVQKRLFKDDEEFEAKIGSYGNAYKAIECIKRKLNMTQLKEFQRTCFGYFLDMQKLEISCQLIHHLGLRRVECDDHEVMEFNLGGSGVRFTDRDFALVTGLKFSTHIEDHDKEIQDIKTSDIQTEYLKKSRKISTKDLLHFFENAQFKTTQDAVKMALLYFLNCGLIGVPRRTKIDLNFVRLVEDLDKFNHYPWGTYIYKMTVKSVCGAFIKSEPNEVRNSSSTYDLKGFPLALQVWAYEVIPKLHAEGFAKREKSCMPRILGWKATTRPSYTFLHDSIFIKNNYEVSWTLNPTRDELAKDYMTLWINGYCKRRCRAPPVVEAVVESEPVVEPATAQSAAADDDQPGSLSYAPNDTKLDMIVGRIDRIEQRLDTLQSEMTEIQALCLAILEKVSTSDPSSAHDPREKLK